VQPAPSTPSKSIVPGILVVGAVVLVTAVVLVFFLLRESGSDSAPTSETAVTGSTTQERINYDVSFDLELELDASPLSLTFRGDDMILTNRLEPWGLVVVRHHGGERFEQVKLPVIESTYNQRVGLSTVTWNGSHLVCITEGSWVESDSEDVFMLLDPERLSIEWWYPAPRLLGALAWDGDGYWAATRRNTEAANEPAYLYRIDSELEVVDRLAPPGVGCQGLAVHRNLLYFADVFTGTVTVLDTLMKPPRVVERMVTGFNYLSGVGHDGERLWVTEYGSDRLLRIGRQTLASVPRPTVRYARLEPTVPSVPTIPSSESTVPSEPTVPSSESTDVSQASLDDLRAGLRSDDPFERMHAENELRRRGVPPDFDREEEISPEMGAEDVSIPWWQAEMTDGTITASWEIFFGHALFSDLDVHRNGPVTVPLFVYYTIEVEGGDLVKPVRLELEGRPGTQTINDQVLASDLGQGIYRLNLFVHVQYLQPEGGAKIFNTSAFQLEVGW
jgi:hypothetical protein